MALAGAAEHTFGQEVSKPALDFVTNPKMRMLSLMANMNLIILPNKVNLIL